MLKIYIIQFYWFPFNFKMWLIQNLTVFTIQMQLIFFMTLLMEDLNNQLS